MENKQNKIYKILSIIIVLLIAIFGGTNLNQPSVNVDLTDSHWYQSIPEFRGTPYIEINNNIPFFTEKDKKNRKPFENYSELDNLGRCGPAFANICEELMPNDDRGDISNVKPSGWVQKQYRINGKKRYIYNRSHLIAYSLAGENDNKLNLITGTDYMNHDGMIPFERTVKEYIDANPSKHVLYRVTPVFEGNDLVAKGVLMEAYSVEDNGYEVQFCVFCYNVQPTSTKTTNYKLIQIDYATGKSKL